MIAKKQPRRLIVELPKKYQKDIEEKWINMKKATYYDILGSKSIICEDHFKSPSGCQASCPFSRFYTMKNYSGCMAWLEELVKPFGISLNPPFQPGDNWGNKFSVLSGEVRKHIKWV